MATVVMAEVEIAEDGRAFRLSRNWIRVGDLVDVAPSREGRRDGFVAELRSIVAIEAGVIVEVYGGRKNRAAAIRTLPIERIKKKAKAGAKVDRSGSAPPPPRRRIR